MEEVLMLGVKERKMEVELYGNSIQLLVREPTNRDLVVNPLRIERAKDQKKLFLTAKTGLEHIIQVKGLGYEEKVLVTDPKAEGYRPDWKKILARDPVGIKLGVLVASELYFPGQKNYRRDDGPDDDLDDMEEGESRGEASAAVKKAAEK